RAMRLLRAVQPLLLRGSVRLLPFVEPSERNDHAAISVCVSQNCEGSIAAAKEPSAGQGEGRVSTEAPFTAGG
ncbi:unnamed protein product, partial [Effrenium voratum]